MVLLDGRQLAERLGTTYERVMDMHRMEEIPSIKLANGRVAFNLDAVVATLCPSVAERPNGRRARGAASAAMAHAM